MLQLHKVDYFARNRHDNARTIQIKIGNFCFILSCDHIEMISGTKKNLGN